IPSWDFFVPVGRCRHRFLAYPCGMGKQGSSKLVHADEIERAIKVVRGQRVMLDSELARLYGVATGALNQAVKRNADRFPPDLAYQLTRHEFADLISQSVISRGGRRKVPWAFTEHGVAMLSSVLRSRQAARVNVEIMRAFVRLRRLLATPGGASGANCEARRNSPATRRTHHSHRSGAAP